MAGSSGDNVQCITERVKQLLKELFAAHVELTTGKLLTFLLRSRHLKADLIHSLKCFRGKKVEEKVSEKWI